MDHQEKVTAIMTQDLPALIGILESKYGKAWLEKNFAFISIIAEPPPSSMFQTVGYGDTAGFMKCAHSIIRSLARIAQEKNPETSEVEKVKTIINTLWTYIVADFGREGVPETIFNAVLEKQKEDTEPSA